MRPLPFRTASSLLSLSLAVGVSGCLSVAEGAPPRLQRDDEGGKRGFELSAGLGILGAGKAEVEDVTYVTDSEVYGRVSLDHFGESGEVGLGAFVDTGTIDYGLPSGDARFTTVGLAVKGRYFDFEVTDDVDLLITPGVGVGYRVDDEGTDGLALNFGVDLRARFAGFDLFIEPGVLTQPVGSDAGREQTFRPLPYALFGAGIRF